MNWIQNLYETYEACQASIGYSKIPGQRPLLPVCHITTQAHIEIAIDGQGNFRSARVIDDKAASTTIIPASEESASRAGSKPATHPLCDKLQYVAGDFAKYGGVVTSGYAKKPGEPHQNFLSTLRDWSSSPYSHPKAKAVLLYSQQGHTIADLVKEQVLFLNGNGRFAEKSDLQRAKTARDIFSVVDPQYTAFVRWVVNVPGEIENRVWADPTLWESWINFYLADRTEKSVCMVTGEDRIITTNHPKYIRREGDGAKLISANDQSGYTYRGRFLTGLEACGVGLEVSQKAHYALAWLISRQGYRKGDLAVVAWAKSGTPVPQPLVDTADLLYADAPEEADRDPYTGEDVALPLRSRIAGYSKALGSTESVVVMAVDSATPGRMSITYYRDLTASEFLTRINTWHTGCSWPHHYRFTTDPASGKRKIAPFTGAPAPADIAEAAYGTRLDDHLSIATISRLLPCIIDGLPVPRDLVESVVRRASNRAGLDEWEWRKILSIACSLVKMSKQGKETYTMPLDENRNTRDYLYGRLLAVADVLEERALYKSEQKRPTNAARYMQQFSQSPLRTWKQIHDALTPYILRLQGAYFFKNLLAEIEGKFETDDFIANKPLSGEYLLGYYCQRQKLLEKKDPAQPDDSGEIQTVVETH